MNAKLKKFLIAAAAVAAAALLFLAGYFTYYLTMSGGLRSLLWVKDMVQDEYYEEVSDDEFWQAAIDGVMDSLDAYSAYYTADEYDAVIDSAQGIRSGIGASFFSGTNKVYRIALNSPLFFAAEGGVEAGMYLTGVGESESSLTLTDTYAKVSAALSSASGKVVLRFSSVSASDTENCVYVTVEPAVYTESHVLYASGGKAYAYLLAGEEYVWTDVSAYVTVEEKVPEGAATKRTAQIRCCSTCATTAAAGCPSCSRSPGTSAKTPPRAAPCSKRATAAAKRSCTPSTPPSTKRISREAGYTRRATAKPPPPPRRCSAR